MSDASPAPKRARLSESESQASNVVPPQIYRVRVTLPSYRGFRVFDVPESASFHELHLHSGEAFNREPDSHCYQFEHPSLVFFHSPPESLAPRRRRVSTVHPSFDRVSPRGCAHDNETPPPRPVPHPPVPSRLVLALPGSRPAVAVGFLLGRKRGQRQVVPQRRPLRRRHVVSPEEPLQIVGGHHAIQAPL